MHKTRIYLTTLIILNILSYAQRAQADFIVIQNLHFGEFIIQNNNARHRLTIFPDGSFSHGAEFIETSPPQHGIYQIDELEPNTIINVTATQIQPMIGSNNFFTLENFQVSHTNVDNAGLANIMLGADAVTSGNGSRYAEDTYSGQIQIQINY